MTVSSIECIGSEYPMGVLQGRLYKDSISAVWQLVQNSHMMDHVRPMLVPKQLHILHCQKKADTFLKNYLAKFFPNFNERIHGVAQGAALAEEVVYFLQALELEMMTKTDTYATGSGISMALMPEKMISEELVLAANFDHVLPLADHVIIRKSRPRDGFHSLDLTYTFLAGSQGGLNEKGLVILSIPAYANDSISLKTIPLTLLIQEVLKTCSTIDEAIKFISAQNRDSGAVILLADSSNKVQLLELSRGSQSNKAISGEYHVQSNRLSLPELQKFQLAAEAVWSSKAWGPFAGQKVYEASEKRTASAKAILDKTTVFDLEHVWKLLADHGSGIGDDNSICRHGNALTTIASIVILPKSKSIQVKLGNPCTGHVQQFNL